MAWTPQCSSIFAKGPFCDTAKVRACSRRIYTRAAKSYKHCQTSDLEEFSNYAWANRLARTQSIEAGVAQACRRKECFFYHALGMTSDGSDDCHGFESHSSSHGSCKH